MSDIRETVRTFLLDNFLLEEDCAALSDEADLRESRILDSLSALRLMTFLEDQFHVQLDPEDLESGALFSLAKIEQLVLSRTAQRA
jgi:acyl carrier protein